MVDGSGYEFERHAGGVSVCIVMEHELGLHLRAAGVLVQVVGQFTADVTVAAGGMETNAKSIMGVLALGAGPGTELRLCANGEDAESALHAIIALIENDFEISGEA